MPCQIAEIPRPCAKMLSFFATRRTGHDILFHRLHPQCERRQAIRDQVDPQQLVGSSGVSRHSSIARNTVRISPRLQDSRKCTDFFDIVINTAAFAYRRNDGGEIVVGQGHICRTFCYISTGDAHCAADIRRF